MKVVNVQKNKMLLVTSQEEVIFVVEEETNYFIPQCLSSKNGNYSSIGKSLLFQFIIQHEQQQQQQQQLQEARAKKISHFMRFISLSPDKITLGFYFSP
jgi:hypothetical protein